ncbi:choice-of-anchor Q domain-containing protein [Sorangium sp. So ce1389]|uniref:choice-of-anchor Q domain-containing protein n=1 Tax=Sorangium sp. So ce1389 TaxID=3133336 RepID=UPI003F647296
MTTLHDALVLHMRDSIVAGQACRVVAAAVVLLLEACGGKVIVEVDNTNSGPSSGGGMSTTTGSASGSGGSGGSAEHATPCDEAVQAWVAATGDCAGASPCYSVIQDAIDESAAGATIWVLPGNYGPSGAEHVVVSTEKLVCLRSVKGPEVTTLDGKGAGTVVRAGYKGALWLEGFTIRGAGPEGSDVLDGYGVGMGGWEQLRGWVIGNIFEDNVLGAGALLFDSGTVETELDVLVSGNVFRHNETPTWESTIYIDFPGLDGASGVVRVENNVIANNQGHGLSFPRMFGGIWSFDWLRIEVVNNTVTGNRRGLVAPVDGIFVHNNILFGNEEDAYLLASASEASVLNNLFGVAPEFVGAAGNIDGDPAFVGAGGEDFRLQAHSPARDAGTPKLAPTVDIERNARDIVRPDIGAFEAQESP